MKKDKNLLGARGTVAKVLIKEIDKRPVYMYRFRKECLKNTSITDQTVRTCFDEWEKKKILKSEKKGRVKWYYQSTNFFILPEIVRTIETYEKL